MFILTLLGSCSSILVKPTLVSLAGLAITLNLFTTFCCSPATAWDP